MEQENMNSLTRGWKILAVFAYALVTIITCSAVWNAGVGGFLSAVAFVLLASNGYVIYRAVKKLKEED